MSNVLRNISNNFSNFLGVNVGKTTVPQNGAMTSRTKIVFCISSLLIFGLLLYGYSDHFHNPFYIDDSHTISSNKSIRDLKNIPSFFSDATTTSSLPANQSYRPGLTTLNAIDFWIGKVFGDEKEPVPFYYHLSIFISYLILGILLFFLFYKIFIISLPHRWTPFFALFATSFYMLHTANVETITYIISRSDSFSTLMIVMAMVIYLYKPSWRKWYIYAIPIIIGFFVKEPAIMFVPILLIFILLFEEKISFTSLFNGEKTKQGLSAFLKTIPLFILAVVLYTWSIHKTPTTWTSGAGTSFSDRMEYLQTQAFVVFHYFNNFFFPFNLSADTDWKVITHFFDDRVIIGIIFIAILVTIAFRSSKQEKYYPIAFGISWYILALIPTSSIFPFAEVLNDHRTFFPYIGLTMAAVWPLALLVAKYEANIVSNVPLTMLTIALPFAILLAHVKGVRTRVHVWSSEETLWHDVTIKSPNNGRGLMHYGNTLMQKNEYDSAREYLNKAKALCPDYSDIYIHLGALGYLTGNQSEAEINFKHALKLDGGKPECYYYYANWLFSQGRFDEAKTIVQQGLGVSVNHIDLNKLSIILQQLPSGANALDVAILRTKSDPSAENYINLSVAYCDAKNYELAIEAAEAALDIRPGYDLAYNNIFVAYYFLKQYDKAIDVVTEGLKSNPNSAQLKEKLNFALQEKQNNTVSQQLPPNATVLDSAILKAKENPSPVNYLDLSAAYYNVRNYELALKAAENALKLQPDYDLAYNNICVIYNALKQWDKAIDAATKGLKINPDNELLKNNLNLVLQEKNKK